MLTIFLLRNADTIDVTWLRRFAKTSIYLVFTLVFSIVALFLIHQAVNFNTSHPTKGQKATASLIDTVTETYSDDNLEKQSQRSLKKFYNYYPHTTKTSQKYFATTTQSGKKQILSNALQYRDIKSLVAICYKEPTKIHKDYVFACASELGINNNDEITSDDSMNYYDLALTKADKKYVTPQLKDTNTKFYIDDDGEDIRDSDKEKPNAFFQFMDRITNWLGMSVQKGCPNNFTIILLAIFSNAIFFGLYCKAFPDSFPDSKDLSKQ